MTTPRTGNVGLPCCSVWTNEVVPTVVEIENGGSSGPGGVARTAFHQERRNRHEKKVHETRQLSQGFEEGPAKEGSSEGPGDPTGIGPGGSGGDAPGLDDRLRHRDGLEGRPAGAGGRGE